jgi:isoleucyl-tRNA synthetase
MQKSETEDQIKIRQPLSKLVYADEKLPEFYEQIIAEEVNVKTVENGKELFLDKTLTDDLKREGYARELVRANGVADIVEVIQGTMEDIVLPEKGEFFQFAGLFSFLNRW